MKKTLIQLGIVVTIFACLYLFTIRIFPVRAAEGKTCVGVAVSKDGEAIRAWSNGDVEFFQRTDDGKGVWLQWKDHR